jgi:hypothetical protein
MLPASHRIQIYRDAARDDLRKAVMGILAGNPCDEPQPEAEDKYRDDAPLRSVICPGQ